MTRAVAESAAEFADLFSRAPAEMYDWTQQLLEPERQTRHVVVALSELERDRLVSILRTNT